MINAFDTRRGACAKLSALMALSVAPGRALAQNANDIVTWNIDNLTAIGGHGVKLDGTPHVIATEAGKAVLFDGEHDGMIVDNHPLAGFSKFTMEALARPDGGQPEQRWFHLAETDPATGLDATTPPDKPTSDKNNRFTFELRVVGDQVYFESFTHGQTYQSALADKTKLHPIGQWIVLTQTYDGTTHRSYVDGVLEKEAPLTYVPQGKGRASIGMRINHFGYYKGLIARARFAPRALDPAEFMKVPAALKAKP